MIKSKIHVVEHALVADSLTHLRNQYTGISKFRHFSNHICQFLFSEAVKDLDLSETKITTPLEIEISSQKIKDEIIIIPVLRSGIAMLSSAMQFLPKAKVGFIGLERDEDTAVAHEYYLKTPKIRSQSVVIVTDPMLATGGSIMHLLEKVAPQKPKKMLLVCVVAAPEGITAIQEKFPEVEIFVAAVDDHLNEVKYIVPGIGDYGDRYFGTSV